jgi:diguanylate cyclase (GGDEF)-like protein
MVQALAQWNETHQQLIYDEYYAIWRDNRVRDAGMVPDWVDGVALYDKQGRILRPNQSTTSPMLDAIPNGRPTAGFYSRHLGRDHYYVFFPIHADPDHAIPLGYGGLRVDLLETLRAARHYRYADVDRLRLNPQGDRDIALRNLVRHMDIPTRADPEAAGYLDSLMSSLLRLMLIMVIILTLGAWLLNRILVRPLQRLSEDISALTEMPMASQPALSTARHTPVLEMEKLRDAFNDYHSRLAEMHRHLERSSQDFYDQARRDALTGAFNRRAFDEDWQAVEQDKRARHCTLILFDCDHFKAINDTYGHPVGDAVIRAIAACLVRALRADDRLYRLGGDEFAALLSGTDFAVTTAIAERCLDQINAHDFAQYGITEPVSISIGLAHAEGHIDLPALHKQADLAMYHAKRPGNRKIVVYDASLGELSSLLDNRDVSAVYQAIREPDMLEFRYQPIVRLPAVEQEYAEALCRIRREGHLIGPGAIFAIVHNRRLDVEFDLAVIAAIRRDMAAGIPAVGAGVSINLSAPGVVSDKVLAALLALRADFPARKIVVEITETALITQMETATAHIQALREAGCLVALDDFGSGYSSLRYLASMPVDMVKFDMTLVRLLEQQDLRQRLVVEDIAEMVATAGYDLVAEGIETRVLLEKVIQVGFSHGQGFYLDELVSGQTQARSAQAR